MGRAISSCGISGNNLRVVEGDAQWRPDHHGQGETGATPTGVAVDAAGDVFWRHMESRKCWKLRRLHQFRLRKTHCWGSAGVFTVLLPLGVAVDKAGDVFFPVTGTSAGVIKQAPPLQHHWRAGQHISNGLSGRDRWRSGCRPAVSIDRRCQQQPDRRVHLRQRRIPEPRWPAYANGSGQGGGGLAGDHLVTEGSANLAVELQREAVGVGCVKRLSGGTDQSSTMRRRSHTGLPHREWNFDR